MTLSPHPAAALFPLLGETELAELAADIHANGLRLPIVTHEGTVLDGRNRLRACELAGVAPRFEEFAGPDPIAYVVGVNLHRRHLNESQRAMVAERVRAAGGANWPPGRTADAAAELLNVGARSVKRAHQVLAQGVPELVEAVDRGEVAVSAAALVASAPAAEQREIVARGEREIIAKARELRSARIEENRDRRLAKLAAIAGGNRPLALEARGPWPVILADPPWRHEHSSDERATENHYPTMALEDICALAVGDVATPDAVLFMWAPTPKLEEAMRVIDAWGFRYRTALIWVKPRIGLGHYVRARSELLLLAVRGDMPAPAPSNRPDAVFEAAQREHSRKPDETYAIIERMYPGLPRVELFARHAWPGWDAWGNQAPTGDLISVAT